MLESGDSHWFQRTSPKKANNFQKSGSLSLKILSLSQHSTHNAKNKRCPAGHVKLCSSRAASVKLLDETK